MAQAYYRFLQYLGNLLTDSEIDYLTGVFDSIVFVGALGLCISLWFYKNNQGKSLTER